MFSLKVIVCLSLIAAVVNCKDLRSKHTKAIVIDSNLPQEDQAEIAQKCQSIYEEHGENRAWEYRDYLQAEKYPDLLTNVFTNFDVVKFPHETVYYIILNIGGEPVHAYGLREMPN